MSAGDEIEWGDDIDWDDPDQFAKRKAQLKARRESAEVIFAPDHGRRDDMPPKEEAAPKADGTGNFFAVDRRCFHRACSLGLNPAVAYLIEARGTGRDHATTSWSRTSIQHKAGIRYRSAAEALAALIGDGLARQTKAGARPQYELVPWADHPRFDAREPLSSYDRQFIEKELGEIDGNTRKWARRLAQQGWLKEINLFTFIPVPAPHPAPDLIWLPNAIVDGVGAETPPVKRLRESQDVMLLRLFVDLYGAQHLADDGGIRPDVLWKDYDRHHVGQCGAYTVWGFVATGTTRANGEIPQPHIDRSEEKPWDKFWARETKLIQLGLLEFVPHLRESADAAAENIHPYGMTKTDSIEDRLREAAHHAGHALLTPGQSNWAQENKLWLAPAPHHMDQVAMVGIARLRYRAKTRVAAAWQAGLHEVGQRFLTRYERLQKQPESESSTLDTA